MEDLGLGAGIGILAFWGFVAAVVIGGIWDNIRKREAQHETMRRIIESGQSIDKDLIDQMLNLSSGSQRHDRDLKITALWILPVSVGLTVFGYILGGLNPDVVYPIMGAGALTACLGIGFWIAGSVTSKWYDEDVQ